MIIRTINDVKNPRWVNRTQTLIDLDVDFEEEAEAYISFTADPNDEETYGVTLYNNAVNGDYGTIAEYTPPQDLNSEDSMALLKELRDDLLKETDYIEMPTMWSTLSADEQTAWGTYRNALRDLPTNYPDALRVWNEDADDWGWSNVTFPTKP